MVERILWVVLKFALQVGITSILDLLQQILFLQILKLHVILLLEALLHSLVALALIPILVPPLPEFVVQVLVQCYFLLNLETEPLFGHNL